MNSIRSGDSGDAKWYLSRKGKHRGYAERKEIELGNLGDDALQIGVKVIDYRHSIAALAPRPVPDSSTSSEDQSAINGETLGQDGAGRSADDDGLE